MTEKLIKQSDFSSFYKEKKEIQRIWNGLTINNSWENFIINMPHSISALERLTVESLKCTYFSSHSEPTIFGNSPPAMRKHRAFTESIIITNDLTVRSTDSILSNSTTSALRPHIMEIINETQHAFIKTIHAMKIISKNVDEIPRMVKHILDVFSEPNIVSVEEQLRTRFIKLQKAVEDCAYPAFSLETVFSRAEKLCDGKHPKIVRKGFMLLNEVQHLFQWINEFFVEISKLIEFALDATCNLMIRRISEEVEMMGCQPKYVIKTKTVKEIYRYSLTVIVYSLVLRQIARSYYSFANQFILPQIEVILQYCFVINSEMELQAAQKRFHALNVASRKEIDKMMKANRIATRRPSVVEIDFGLNLHLSEIISDINGSLFMMGNVSNKLGTAAAKDGSSIKFHMNSFVNRLRKKLPNPSKSRSNTL